MIGRPRFSDVLIDAVVRLRRPIVPTAIAVLIILGATTTVFATTGIAVASQARTLDRLNSPHGRLITITDAQGTAGMSPESVSVVALLSGVEWAAGIGPAKDFSNSNLPNPHAKVSARDFYGDFPPALHATTDPRPGQAILGAGLASTLQLGDGVGAISSRARHAVVVGSFVADDPLTALNDNVLLRAEPGTGRLLTLWVSATDISQLSTLTDAVAASVVANQPGALRVETAGGLAQLGDDVITEMARTARLTVTGLLLAVTLLISAVQFGRVAAMARDIGRRRALGASRNSILVQVLLNAALCALIGTTTGLAAGLALTAVVAGALPPPGFCLGVSVLMVLAALVGTLPPAIRAAHLDPVKVLRVP